MHYEAILKRRRFLVRVASSLAWGAGFLGLGARAAVAAQRRWRRRSCRRAPAAGVPAILDLSTLAPDTFSELVGDTFQVRGARPAVVLVLTDVRRYDVSGDSTRPAGLRGAPFSLLFEARGGEQLGDSIQRVVHPQVGEMRIYLQEVGREGDAAWRYYEAIFN